MAQLIDGKKLAEDVVSTVKRETKSSWPQPALCPALRW